MSLTKITVTDAGEAMKTAWQKVNTFIDDYEAGTNAAAHNTKHQNGGADEISVTGLSGLLADDQHVLDAEVLAAAGINSGITSMTGLDDGGIPLAKVDGAAASGANADITSLTALSGQQTIPSINLTDGQIAFPATAVPSADANTLDDYEEGTITPTIYGSTTAGSPTYVAQVGRYVKIGAQVSFTLYVYITAKGGIDGNVCIGGFPFTSNATASLYYLVCAENGLGVTLAAGTTIEARIDPDTNYAKMLYGGSVGANFITSANIADATSIILTGHYEV